MIIKLNTGKEYVDCQNRYEYQTHSPRIRYTDVENLILNQATTENISSNDVHTLKKDCKT